MFKFLKYIKNQFLLSKRLNEEEERQKREGYKIEFIHEGNESYITYCEGNKRIPIGYEFTWLNDVILNTNSFRKGLTIEEYEKVKERLVRYFSCWGGEIILDDSPSPFEFDWRSHVQKSEKSLKNDPF
jgi:hypothetical protein